MAPPRRSEDQLNYVKELIEGKLREGYRPTGMNGSGRAAILAAAVDAVKAGTFKDIANFKTFAYSLEGSEYEPDWNLWRPASYGQPVPRQVLYPAVAPEPELLQPAGRSQRILVIGDLHQDPRHPHRLDVLTWIARYASEERFERIIQVGDWSTWDSVSSHDKNDTQAARLKPGVKDDLENLTASHRAFRRGMSSDYRPKLDFLLGNHEYRVERFENANPETAQTFTLSRDETFAQFGWRSRPYGELLYVENVGFTHHPTNGAGRAFGGKTGPQRAANESTVPVVSGHTHRRQVHDSPKIGPLGVISMVEVGCAMPWGDMESYAAHSLTGWFYGVCAMTVTGGAITDLNFTSMITLRNRYSDDGSDIAA